MRQTISTVLASNESLTVGGPGFVKVTTGTSATISKVAASQAAVTSGALAKTTSGAKIAGISFISGPFIGLVALASVIVLMAKMADDANARK